MMEFAKPQILELFSELGREMEARGQRADWLNDAVKGVPGWGG